MAATAREVLSGIYLFSEMSPAELDELAAVTHRRRVPRDTIVVRQDGTDTELYAVVSGLVRVSVRATDGREFALHLLGPGQVFGELGLLDGRGRSATVTTVKSSELLVMPRAELMRLLNRCPALAIRMLVSITGYVRRLTTRSEELSALPVGARLAKKLLEIADICGTVVNANCVALPLNLSQQDLAQHVQATRESVNKCLAGWIRAGIVQRTHEQIIIRDRVRLAAAGTVDGERTIQPRNAPSQGDHRVITRT